MAVTTKVADAELIGGPSALSGGWSRFFHLTWTLAVHEFKLRFFGSVLGYFWQLMRPLLLFGVLYVIFAVILHIGEGTNYFPAVLLFNIVLYTFYAEATTASVRAVVDRESIVRKIRFPRLVIPASVVLTATFNLVLNVIVVLIFAAITGVTPHAGWLFMPLILVLLAAFTLGTAMLLSALFVRFRDIQPIWEVVLQALFYATPILYPIETVQDKLPKLASAMMANPLAALMEQSRHWIIDPSAPTAADVIGGVPRLLIPLGILFGVVVRGFWYYNREAPRIAERL
jgi:ABC-2 type transport system permease protein